VDLNKLEKMIAHSNNPEAIEAFRKLKSGRPRGTRLTLSTLDKSTFQKLPDEEPSGEWRVIDQRVLT
jgi:hypothetical protein